MSCLYFSPCCFYFDSGYLRRRWWVTSTVGISDCGDGLLRVVWHVVWKDEYVADGWQKEFCYTLCLLRSYFLNNWQSILHMYDCQKSPFFIILERIEREKKKHGHSSNFSLC